ncbi:MAG: NHL repeat-containing protein, partial [Bacteroidota bacterium]
MAAVVALTAFWALWVALPDQPVLVEVMRVPVSSGVRRIAVGSLGQWYLTDVEHHTVILRSSEGSLRADVGGYGWGLSALDRPSGVATDGVRVYVSDQGNHRIVEYDRDLRPLSAFSTRDTSESNLRFGFPRGVAVSSRGDLIVLDGESEEVVCYSSGGRFVFRVGREVSGGRPLHRPACIAVDDGQRLLIGETGAVRILDLFGTEIEEMSLSAGSEVRGVAGKDPWLAWV